MFGRIWQRWKSVNSKILDKEATIILLILYWVLVTPLAPLVKIFLDPLNLKPRKGTSWFRKETENVSNLNNLKKQY